MNETIIHESWKYLLSGDTIQKAMDEIQKKRELGIRILPEPDKTNNEDRILYALKLTPFEKLKVLIIGQDPYPNKEDAQGLAFSSLSSIRPPSLRKIFENIEQEFPDIKHESNDLTSWAEQGVLLLNMALSYESKNKKDEHIKIWHPLITQIIDSLERRKPLVVMLWGISANKLISESDDINFKEKGILILRSSHPQARNNARNHFKNCQHFIKCNNFLNELGLVEIDWST